MEFHGDYWHGNPKCYSAKTLNKVVGMTMGDLYQKTLEKEKILGIFGIHLPANVGVLFWSLYRVNRMNEVFYRTLTNSPPPPCNLEMLFSAVEPRPLSCMPRQMKTPISNILMWRLSTLSSIKRARFLWDGSRSWPKILTCSKTTKVSLNVASFLQSVSTRQSSHENQQQAPVWSLSNLHGESDTDMWTHWPRQNDHWNLGYLWGENSRRKGLHID